LQPSWRTWIFLLVVVGVAVLLGGAAVRAAYISILGESVEAGTLKRAIALDPSDPELHHRLGMVLFDSPVDTDRIEGLKQLHRATELNPYAARYWADLSWVCELAGDTACATQGVERAVKLNPMTPQLRWVAANTLLRAGQNDEAMAQFRRLLELDPAYAPATFNLCLGLLGDPQLILQKVLPPGKNPALKLAYLNILSRSEMDGADDLARQVWAKTVAEGTAFPLTSATPYIEHLLQFGQVEEAQSAWRDLEKLGVVANPGQDQDGNLIYNGDFEQMPLNAGFDWRNLPAPYLALDFSDPAAHSGKSCLRIDFTVNRNEEYRPLFQLVPVAPNQAYTLTAYVRSQDITSDSGPRLQVVDPIHSNGPNAMSETTVGTTPWHQINLKFCTGPDTKLVQLSILRVRGRTFPTEITGSFWLDTVAMKPLGPSGASACTASGH
jgi:tetratricopeptide (TPR) repeat protein